MPSPPSRAVISVLNTPAGRFRWYEDFPEAITARLAEHGIAHHVGYKSYLPHTRLPEAGRLTVHDEHDATDPDRLRALLEPLCARYDQVIVHTHSYQWPRSQFWRVTRGHRNRAWWATVHTTMQATSPMKRAVRSTLQALRIAFPDRVFGCSHTAAAALRPMLPARRIGVLQNGLLTDEDLTRFEPRPAVPRTALFIGRFDPSKGVILAVETAAILAERYPDFRLIMVGDGPEHARVARRIAELEIQERVMLAGYQSNVAPWYRRADMVCIPTDPAGHREGLPLVALEAQAHALPVIYTASGGLPESQVEGATGLLLADRTAPAMAALCETLMADPSRYAMMRTRITDTRRHWAMSRMIDDYVRVYLDALPPARTTR
jgi:glycosyltransferase involved in cell wall biosynthesis